MSPPDLEIRDGTETVWRVGFEPDPWAWTPWSYATDSGLFDGRWDDQWGNFRTLYTAESLLGCFLELLAKLRPDDALEAELAAIEDPDRHCEVFPDSSGTIGYDWCAGRRYGRAVQTGRYCFITHSRSVAAVAAGHVLDRLGIARRDVDTALLKNAGRRTATRTVASWLYDLRDEQRQPLVDGVTFLSRYGDDLRMWAIFERTSGSAARTDRVGPLGRSRRVTPELPALVEALSRHGLSWAEPAHGEYLSRIRGDKLPR
jgi:hypothetical protein